MPRFENSLITKLNNLKTDQRFRSLSTDPLTTTSDWICFNSNDYFNLSCHPLVIEASVNALRRHGNGPRASRLLLPTDEPYRELEHKLSQYKCSEAALLFGSGYLANIGVISALAGKEDLILADRLIHASMLDGVKLSGATLKRFNHNDTHHCERLLKRDRHNYRHCFILTETIFSMDGDQAPIASLLALASTYDATLISDDAHGLGFLPPPSDHNPHHIQIGTLSKGLGAYGGYVCASQITIDYLINHARSFIYATALPLPVIAAASTAFDLLIADSSLQQAPLTHAQLVCQELNLPPPAGAIVPYVIGSNHAALALANSLKRHHLLVSAIRPPTVPKDTARLRLTFHSAHTKEQLHVLVKYIKYYSA